MPKNQITEAEFHKIWSSCLAEILNSKPSLYNSLKDKKVNYNGEIATIKFENASLLSSFDGIRAEIIEYFNTHADNPLIKFNLEVEKAAEETKRKYVVSPKDIFKQMKEKNPQLEELQKRFNLRID